MYKIKVALKSLVQLEGIICYLLFFFFFFLLLNNVSSYCKWVKKHALLVKVCEQIVQRFMTEIKVKAMS
jgi:hypothetical protein